MIDDLRITVLVENTVRRPGLLAEHGWALWIEADGHRLLFDAGQGEVLPHNADRLGIQLDTVEKIVVSHGHFDHTGGLADVLHAAPHADLYLHPAALERKYHREKRPPHRSIGIPQWDKRTLRGQAQSLTRTREPTELIPGVSVTGEIPRRNDFEDTGGPFYRDLSCTDPDPLTDDQAMFIETPAGLVVVLGCAHAGIINTLDYIAELTDRSPIHTVIGGMHLMRSSLERIDATVDALLAHGVQKVGTAHCTGIRATTRLWSRMPGECFECAAGSTLSIPEPTDHSSRGD